MRVLGNSLVVQGLGLHAFTAKGAGSVPGWGTKILQATHGAAKKKKNESSRSRLPGMVSGSATYALCDFGHVT